MVRASGLKDSTFLIDLESIDRNFEGHLKAIDDVNLAAKRPTGLSKPHLHLCKPCGSELIVMILDLPEW